MLDQRFNPDVRKALASLLAHTAAHSPYYRGQAWAKSVRGGASVALKNIPVTAKSLVREQPDRFYISAVPPSEGKIMSKYTSGSTGHPMEVRQTSKFYAINDLERTRLLEGWGFERYSCGVVINNPDVEHPRGSTTSKYKKGGSIHQLYTSDAYEAVDFIAEKGAQVLHNRPSMCAAILQHAADRGIKLPLALITTTSELVPDQFRMTVRSLPGCRLVDRYSAVETLLIATECAQCGAYHPADRKLVLEVLDDNDKPVKAGKMGRIIVTSLFNLAMPLIRYEIGDYAVIAEADTCPRASMSLTRIVGRERNVFKMPDGRKVMPWLDPEVALSAGLHQFKMIQHSLAEIELLYIPHGTVELSSARAQELVEEHMGPGFNVKCTKVENLPPAPNGKYMMHECLI
ncbi:AMP-binding protein [Taklimakanibacter deserti]|uniref:AMP-binding protein n=1 Tax=Taklimakanibacter deserti TaxID=2267839 RepID=UPI000E649605